jgi:hypothetical protein
MEETMDVHEEEEALEKSRPNSIARIGRGLAIRDDGVLVPLTDDILRLPDVRPYHGDPNWTLEQRIMWLKGMVPTAKQEQVDDAETLRKKIDERFGVPVPKNATREQLETMLSRLEKEQAIEDTKQAISNVSFGKVK